VIGLFGGAFDPPHNGHVALVAAARASLPLEEVVVLVSSDPAHKRVDTPAESRLKLAAAAFPGERVMLDPHARTIEMLRAHAEWSGAVFLMGADQFLALPTWAEPGAVLEAVEIAVATRPGIDRAQVDATLAALGSVARVRFFEPEPMPIASNELRARLDRGEDVRPYVPAAVWSLIEQGALYGRRYTATG
jgi:nicotinate-nucleotide adenylyltransferase